jgi:Glycosyl hydrolase family 26
MRLPSFQPRRAVVVVALALGMLAGAAGAAGVPETSADAARALTRLVPPPDGKAYFGFTFRLWDTSDPAEGDARPFLDRIRDSIQFELAGKTPTFLKVYAAWQNPDQSGKPLVPGQYAHDLKDFGEPVMIRLFGGEFNGSWWYGQSPRANPGLTSTDFVSAWRRVVDIFRRVGAANVSFAWIANTYPPSPVAWVDPNITAYYPGDNYVDWIGADIEDFAAPGWLDPIYDFATSHAKPFFLAEFGLRFDGSTLTPKDDQAWLGAMFDYFDSHPDIKAISYFNYNSRPDHGIAWDPSRAVYLYDD